ncbi:MAG: lipopolysaccharide heptosyltransferase II [Acidobacteriota bacterium]
MGRLKEKLVLGARHRLGDLVRRRVHVRPRAAAEIRLGTAPRVLFARLNYRMGNLLLATPVFRAFRARYPEAVIHVVCGDRFARLLEGNPDIDRVWPVPRSHAVLLWRYRALLARLREERFDLAVDCGGGASFLGAATVGLARAAATVAYDGRRYSGYFDVRLPPPPPGTHVIDAQLGLVRPWGIAGEPPGMVLALTDAERAWAARRWAEYGLEGRRVVGFNVGARGDKKWPPGRFAETMRRVDRPDRRLVVFAGPEDRAQLEALGGGLPDGAVVDRTFEPRRFAALIERCALFVTADTGPMHLASAVGVPIVALFRKENAPIYRPRGPRDRLLNEPGGPGVEAVVEAIEDLLAAGSGIPPGGRHARGVAPGGAVGG